MGPQCPMETELLERFQWFKSRIDDSTAAAILTLASFIAPQPKRTGLTTEEAADYLGVSGKTVMRLCKQGRLRKQPVGGRSVRFNVSDLDAVKSSPKSHTNDPHQRHFA